MGDTIDLNCDFGESFGAWTLGDDDALLSLVTSANIACGFHAGDPLTMIARCETAHERGVAIGAHVAYRDLAGFGRRAMEIPPDELYGDVLYQLAALRGIADAVGAGVSYVKPHGALYNRIVADDMQASAVAAAVADADTSLAVLGLAYSSIERECGERGVRFVREAFIDRGYRSDGTLVPRTEPGALLDDFDQAGERAVRMVLERRVESVDGTCIPIVVESLCVHGDTPGALGMAQAVRDALAGAGIRVAAFSGGAVAPNGKSTDTPTRSIHGHGVSQAARLTERDQAESSGASGETR